MITEELRAVINETAYKAAKEVVQQAREAIEKDIELHAAMCPTTKTVANIIAQGQGAAKAGKLAYGILGVLGGLAFTIGKAIWDYATGNK